MKNWYRLLFFVLDVATPALAFCMGGWKFVPLIIFAGLYSFVQGLMVNQS